ncbi:MAG TPA: glycine cleavage system protein GcvH [Tepidisphaeraceae bacterium]|nr:glycine cleavage system protein GcvH [Tepidisphaeraceae bacterium]
MSVPTDRKYLETHEWHLLQGDTVTIGITQLAADELTDITFVDLPSVGDSIQAGKSFGEIESVKATADLMAGVSGTVVAINEELSGNPGLVNKDPYTAGWMIKVQVTNAQEELNKLLTAEEYLKKAGH